MACKACSNLDPSVPHGSRAPPLPDGAFLTPLRSVLEAGRERQCAFCLLLLQIFNHYVPDAQKVASQELASRQSTVHFEIGLQAGQPARVGIRKEHGPKLETVAQLQLYNPAATPIPGWQSLVSLRDPYPSPGDNSSFQFLQDCLDLCTQTHSPCLQESSTTLPKRVLDIGLESTGAIKLCEFDPSKAARYAALSYCWGDGNQLKTTRANIAQMKTCITWSHLPRVFQDAISIARKLEIQYIWIDSLCIIQKLNPEDDDEIDFATEAPKMCDYYANAYITIAASSSPNPTVSFLGQRDNSWTPRSFAIPGQSSVVNTRPHFTRYGKSPEVFGRISTRGWTWQENVLSTRIIHYTPLELMWECKSFLRSECGYSPQNLHSMGLTGLTAYFEVDPFSCWRQLIQSFSTRDLGREEDRLPAVGGLAVKFAPVTDSEYHAGLWRADLPTSLLWEVARQTSKEALAPWPGCPFPSWSWASVKGPVRTDSSFLGGSVKAHASNVDASFDSLRAVARIRDVHCDIPGPSKFHTVRGGHITLTGPVVAALLHCTDPTIARCYKLQKRRDPGLNNGLMSPDCILEPCEMGGGREATVRRSKLGDPRGEIHDPVLCLLVAENLDEKGIPFSFDGIVFGRAEQNGDAYTRVGFFSFGDPAWFNGTAMKTLTIV